MKQVTPHMINRIDQILSGISGGELSVLIGNTRDRIYPVRFECDLMINESTMLLSDLDLLLSGFYNTDTTTKINTLESFLKINTDPMHRYRCLGQLSFEATETPGSIENLIPLFTVLIELCICYERGIEVVNINRAA